MAAISAGLARPAALPPARRRAGLAGTLRSEVTKISSVRSTYWSLGVLVIASVAWSVAFCAGTAAHWSHMIPQARAAFDPTQSSVLGLALLGQLVIVVLGALTVTSEYATGLIRTSLTAMPRRLVLYGAKVVVFASVAAVAAFACVFLCFFVGQRALASTHAAATLSQPHVLRALIASALLVSLSGLFALGLGTVLRSTAGTITAAYGFLFLIPELARGLPASWFNDVVRWLPGGFLVSQISYTKSQSVIPHMFSPWGELAVFASYTAVLLAAGGLMLRWRDA
jgi:ABC-2 type transport system permease protein